MCKRAARALLLAKQLLQFVSTDAYLVLLQLCKHSVPSGRFFRGFVTCGRPINHKRLAIDQSTRHRAPEPAIEAVISIIPKHEILVVVVTILCRPASRSHG